MKESLQLTAYIFWTQHVLVLQVQAVVNGLTGSHNRVEAFICLYARMVDKDNLWLVLYALKVTSHTSCLLFCLAFLSLLYTCWFVMYALSLKPASGLLVCYHLHVDWPPVPPSACLSAPHLPLICPLICPVVCVRLSVILPVSMSVCLSACLPVCLFVSLSYVCWSASLSVSLSISSFRCSRTLWHDKA